MKIVYQGSPGAYSHLAAELIFPNYEYVPSKTFEECFKLCYENDNYKTIIPVSLTSKKDELCLDIVKCYCLMIKDLRKMLPHIITDVVNNEEVVLNKIAKVSFYQKEHKKYNLYKIASEGKNE